MDKILWRELRDLGIDLNKHFRELLNKVFPFLFRLSVYRLCKGLACQPTANQENSAIPCSLNLNSADTKFVVEVTTEAQLTTLYHSSPDLSALAGS
jgi:hypothetical protein